MMSKSSIDVHEAPQRYEDDDRSERQITSEADEAVHLAMPFDVMSYAERFYDMLDVRRFQALRYVNKRRLFMNIPDVGRFKTGVNAWREHFRHWAGRGVKLMPDVRGKVDMPFARCEEEIHYTRRVTELSLSLLASKERVVPDLELCAFDRPIDLAWFAGEGPRQAQHWLPDLDLDGACGIVVAALSVSLRDGTM